MELQDSKSGNPTLNAKDSVSVSSSREFTLAGESLLETPPMAKKMKAKLKQDQFKFEKVVPLT